MPTVVQTAVYQGVLTIPLYVLPYTIPDPSGSGYNFFRGAGSDEALIVAGNCQRPASGAVQFGLGDVDIYTLRPRAALHNQIGAGQTGTKFTGQPIAKGVSYNGNFGYLEAFVQTSGLNTFPQGVADQFPLGNVTMQNPPGFLSPDITKTQAVANPSQLFSGQYIGRILAPITKPGFLPISGSQGVGVSAPGYISVGAAGVSTPVYYTITIPGFGSATVLDNGIAGRNSLNMNRNFFIPDTNGNVFNWAIDNATGFPIMAKLGVDLDVVGGPGIVQPSVLTLVQFDNAAINTRITTFGINTTYYYATAYGMFMALSGPNQDFYISGDGTKYWNIVYAGQGTVPTLTSAAQYQGGPYFGKDGLAYMAPGAMTSAGVNQPLFSNGVTFPYNFYTLPQIPPMNIPCWSSCLDRIGGSPGMLQAGQRE